MNKEVRRKYQSKAKDSFKTMKNLFLYSLATQNRDTFILNDLQDFKITGELVKQYTSEYWQKLESYQINNNTIKDIYLSINRIEKTYVDLLKKLETDYVNSFWKIFPENDFINLMEKDKCHYCHISLDDIETLGEKHKLYKKSLRGWSFEIDRLNSNFEYSPKNCVMACCWCNNAKTDEFSEEEFLKIGKVIEKIWKARLK